jgi:hypothetical protein
MALTEIRFEDSYKKPQRCGYATRGCLRKNRMKDIAIAYKTFIAG